LLFSLLEAPTGAFWFDEDAFPKQADKAAPVGRVARTIVFILPRGCPVQASLGRGFSSAERIRTVGKMPSCSRRHAVGCDSISTAPVSPIA
jgi:hypothetical protein